VYQTCVHSVLWRSQESGELQADHWCTFFPDAEARLVLEVGFMIVPTVAVLYLFCFIDVSRNKICGG
jgi:hypothetical protein